MAKHYFDLNPGLLTSWLKVLPSETMQNWFSFLGILQRVNGGIPVFMILNIDLPQGSIGVLVAQLCLTLCELMDCGLPGSSLHGILLARILEWVPIPFSRESSQSRD